MSPNAVEAAIIRLNIPPEVSALALNRAALVSENRLFRIQLAEGTSGIGDLQQDQLARLQAAFAELNSRSQAAELEVEQLQRQRDNDTPVETSARSTSCFW